jgi:hypothetical protein
MPVDPDVAAILPTARAWHDEVVAAPRSAIG